MPFTRLHAPARKGCHTGFPPNAWYTHPLPPTSTVLYTNHLVFTGWRKSVRLHHSYSNQLFLHVLLLLCSQLSHTGCSMPWYLSLPAFLKRPPRTPPHYIMDFSSNTPFAGACFYRQYRAVQAEQHLHPHLDIYSHPESGSCCSQYSLN